MSEIVNCPHCQTRWTWSDDEWFAVIKRHGTSCQCPDNWICTLCNKRCLEPKDVAEYLKNGAHVDCAERELRQEFRFPKCKCGCTRGKHAGPNAEEYCLTIGCSCDEYRADREAVLVAALERIATMPDYDQDNEHRLRNIADKALKEYRGER